MKVQEEDLQWDSDDDNVLDIEDRDEKYLYDYIALFGFHPFKEVVFLFLSNQRVFCLPFEELEDPRFRPNESTISW